MGIGETDTKRSADGVQRSIIHLHRVTQHRKQRCKRVVMFFWSWCLYSYGSPSRCGQVQGGKDEEDEGPRVTDILKELGQLSVSSVVLYDACI